jgi:hypothetical protein
MESMTTNQTAGKSKGIARHLRKTLLRAAPAIALLAWSSFASTHALASVTPAGPLRPCKGASCSSAQHSTAQTKGDTYLAPATLWATFPVTYYEQVHLGLVIRLCSGIQIRPGWVLTARSCRISMDSTDHRIATLADVGFSTGQAGNPASNNITADIYLPPGGGDIMLLKLRSPHYTADSRYAPITFTPVNYPVFSATTLGYRRYPGYSNPALVKQDGITSGIVPDTQDASGTAMLVGIQGCDDIYDKGGALLGDDGKVIGILSRKDGDYCLYTLVYRYESWIRNLTGL